MKPEVLEARNHKKFRKIEYQQFLPVLELVEARTQVNKGLL